MVLVHYVRLAERSDLVSWICVMSLGSMWCVPGCEPMG